MSLKEEVMKQMQDIYEKKFHEQMYQDTGNGILDADSFDNDDGHAPMKLIDQKCWFKITYYYGVIGPEIMFFCEEKCMISPI